MKLKKMIVKRILAFLVLFGVFYVSNAQQDCEVMLKDVKVFCSEGNYEQAQKMYTQLANQCPSYASEAKSFVDDCKKKSQNKPKPQNISSGYIPAQRFSSDSAYNTKLYFDAEGVSLHSSRVTLDKTVTSVVDDGKQWFRVEIESTNTVVVHCDANPYSNKRKDSFLLLLDNGTSFQTIYVEQDAKKTSPKSKTRTNSTEQTNSMEQTNEEQPIIVKITFEKGKANPKFDNNIGPLITAMAGNNNLSLLIEVYKCESQSELKNLIKAPLIDKRFKEITGYFVNLGIEKSRISKSIIVIDGDKEGAECNCAYAKTRKKE